MRNSNASYSLGQHQDNEATSYKVSITQEALEKHQAMIEQFWPVPSNELCKKSPEFARA